MNKFRKLVVFIERAICLLKVNKNKKNDIIVKVDGIGDYIIFQNHILSGESFRVQDNFLVLNILVKPLVHTSLLGNTFFVDVLRFRRNLIYRISIIYKLAGYEAKRVINFNLTKDFWLSDSIVKSIRSNNKIGSNESYEEEWRYSNLYFQELSIESNSFHEIDRLKFLYQQIYEDVPPEYFPIKKKKNCFLVIGAGHSSRVWSLENYIILSARLIGMGYNVYVVGGPAEKLNIVSSKNQFPETVRILAGRIDLFSLSVLFETCEGLVIGSDTGAMHMAIHGGLSKIIVLSNGNNWRRFMPYNDSNLHGIHYVNSLDYGSTNINDIGVDYIINLIEEYE